MPLFYSVLDSNLDEVQINLSDVTHFDLNDSGEVVIEFENGDKMTVSTRFLELNAVISKVEKFQRIQNDPFRLGIFYNQLKRELPVLRLRKPKTAKGKLEHMHRVDFMQRLLTTIKQKFQ